MFFFFFLANLAFVPAPTSTPSSRTEELISSRYYAGRFLIYDCENAHYACVDEGGEKICQIQWRNALKRKIFDALCMPLEAHKDQAECIRKQQRMVDHGESGNLCEKVFQQKFFGRQR